MLFLLVFLQTDGWTTTPARATVGDTVVIERLIPLEGVDPRARVAPLEASESIQPLGPPRVTYESAGVRVQLVVAAFTPDSITLTMPDIEIVHGDGSVEIVPGGTATIGVGSVLPVVPDSTPDPRPSQAPIGRVTTSLHLPVLLPLFVIIAALTWGGLRRRRRPRPTWDPHSSDTVEPPVQRWIQMGEHRAVAALAMVRLRERLETLVPEITTAMSVAEMMDLLKERHPDWPVPALSDALFSLERASFAPAVAADVMAIVESAEECVRDLERVRDAESPAPVA